ncbi:MAG TPA: hypothetical protein VNL92_01495 [Dehalococcoidia bacterium]|nr:hypothetical protein [Dehalococcoidia bacterium]
MAAQVGKRYKAASGAEFIVTKGGNGTLMDGDAELVLSDSGQAPQPGPSDAADVQLGKRYKSADGSVEVLVIKPGKVDLRCNGEPMELMQPKVLPSAD